MGRKYVEFFRTTDAAHVTSLDKGDSLTSQVPVHDIVLISVTISCAAATAKQILPLLKANSLICDINSLKGQLCDIYTTREQGEALGLHPMHGPSVASFKNQKLIVCPIKEGPFSSWLLDTFSNAGYLIHRTSAKAHDKAMCAVQILRHFSIMVLGDSLKELGITVEDTEPFMSPAYQLQSSLIGRLFDEDPKLYGEIIRANPDAGLVMEKFLRSASLLQELLLLEDSSGFDERFNEIRGFLGASVGKSRAFSDELVDYIAKK